MNSNEEIEALKARVDRIEAWIRGVIKNSQAASKEGGERPAEEGRKFELISFDVKKVTAEEWQTPTYAFKLKVQNLSPRPLILTGKIVFLDEDGFELQNEPILVFTIPAKQLHADSGQVAFLSKSNEHKISDIKAVLEIVA